MNTGAERKRLVELLRKGIDKHESTIENYVVPIWEFLADHILDDGWMRPPVKVGDKVYVVDYTRLGNMIFECTIEEISHFTYGTYYYLNWGLHIPRFKACQEKSFGKTVFTSREDAVKACEGKEDEGK